MQYALFEKIKYVNFDNREKVFVGKISQHNA